MPSLSGLSGPVDSRRKDRGKGPRSGVGGSSDRLNCSPQMDRGYLDCPLRAGAKAASFLSMQSSSSW